MEQFINFMIDRNNIFIIIVSFFIIALVTCNALELIQVEYLAPKLKKFGIEKLHYHYDDLDNYEKKKVREIIYNYSYTINIVFSILSIIMFNINIINVLRHFPDNLTLYMYVIFTNIGIMIWTYYMIHTIKYETITTQFFVSLLGIMLMIFSTMGV